MNRRVRRLTAALCVVVSLGAMAAAASAATQPGSEPAAVRTAPSSAVLSPRRVPIALRRLIAETRLASRLDGFLNGISPTSCLRVNAAGGLLFSRNAETPLIPASTLKLATAAAFLAKAGGEGHFTTSVDGPAPDASGTVGGDLVLVGGGDPMLSTAGYVASRKHPPTPATDLGALAATLLTVGVRRVAGGIAVDDSRFDAERRVPSWKPDYTSDGDVGPIGALAVDDGFVSYSPRLVASSDPGIAAGEALRKVLTGVGIVVDGPTFRAAAKSSHELAAVQSAPYAEIVGEMLRESDNNTAELLLKTLAAGNGGAAATRRAGVAARAAALASLGVPRDAVAAIDGSGLDRSDRATCSALLSTLTTKPGGYDLETMLAVAGQSGTLTDRFVGSGLAGQLRAKTGSLDDVTALVGVTDPAASVPLRFAFVSNGDFSDAGGKALQDQLVAALAAYPDAPDESVLAP